ncbi:MAG: hypothetical protein HKN46_01975 [Acidimicrobiia bacterium]|nr:hypothetical protein [Acidimicrobiia bacterium]
MRLHLFGVVFGIAAGFLVAALVAVSVWGVQLLLGSGDDPFGAFTVGAVLGAFVAGYAGGRTSLAMVFNGAVAGVLFTGSITLLSVLDGSPAPTTTRALFIVIGLVLGGFGGWVAHRRVAP